MSAAAPPDDDDDDDSPSSHDDDGDGSSYVPSSSDKTSESSTESDDDSAPEHGGFSPGGLGLQNRQSGEDVDDDDGAIVDTNTGVILDEADEGWRTESEYSPPSEPTPSEADLSKTHPGVEGLFNPSAQLADVLAAQLDEPAVHVFMSELTKAKMQREQRESGVPPPWKGLNGAPAETRQALLEAEMTEIDGILDSGAAYEVLLKDMLAKDPNTKIYTTLTMRSIKKNGPKKGKAKARVCVNKGPPGVESHSPTIRMATLRMLLAFLAAKKAKARAGDFPQAYLNADQEIYYVYPPASARQYDEDDNRIVWALPKALYGGRASGRHWYFALKAKLESIGLTVSEWDPCLFARVSADGKFHYIGVYVDDLIHVYDDDASYDATIAAFRESFHGYSDLAPLTEIFNAEIAITDKWVALTQTRYIEELMAKWIPDGVKYKARTPAVEQLIDIVKQAAEPIAVKLPPEDHAKYHEIVGAILYLSTVCRPDIAVAVSLLSRALEHPTAATMSAAMRVLYYLAGTKHLGLRYTVGSDTTLTGMSDSDWSVVKSTSGYVFFLCQAAIAYICQKQASIAMSSTEAEIMAASLAALEAVFLRGLLREFRLLQERATALGIDNQGIALGIALAKNYISSSRTKHIERRHLKIRELVEEFKVRPEFVPTDENVADILTKPLGVRKFEKFRKVLLNHEV